MMTNVSYVVVGKAGVGKSTLINEVIGEYQTNVSNDMDHDGTASAVAIPWGSRKFVDTVGLDSMNHFSSISGVRELIAEDPFVVILVCDTTRMTTWTQSFLKLIESLSLRRGAHILVYFRVSEEDIFEDKKEQFKRGLKDARWTYEVVRTVNDLKACMEQEKFCNLPPPTVQFPAKPGSQKNMQKPAAAAKSVSNKTKTKTADAELQSLGSSQFQVIHKLIKSVNTKSFLGEKDSCELFEYFKEALDTKKVNETEFQEMAFSGDRHLSHVLVSVLKHRNKMPLLPPIQETVPLLVRNENLASVFDEIFGHWNNEQKNAFKDFADVNEQSKGNFVEAVICLLLNATKKPQRKHCIQLIHRIQSALIDMSSRP